MSENMFLLIINWQSWRQTEWLNKFTVATIRNVETEREKWGQIKQENDNSKLEMVKCFMVLIYATAKEGIRIHVNTLEK
jgi:hypothetical protein